MTDQQLIDNIMDSRTFLDYDERKSYSEVERILKKHLSNEEKGVDIERGLKTALCTCGVEVYNQDNYCSGCGKKIIRK